MLMFYNFSTILIKNMPKIYQCYTIWHNFLIEINQFAPLKLPPNGAIQIYYYFTIIITKNYNIVNNNIKWFYI